MERRNLKRFVSVLAGFDFHIYTLQEVTWGIDLGSEHERYLAEEVYKVPCEIIVNVLVNLKHFSGTYYSV